MEAVIKANTFQTCFCLTLVLISCFDSIDICDTEELKIWTEVTQHGALPKEISFHAAMIHKDFMYTFGGKKSKGHSSDDVFAFDCSQYLQHFINSYSRITEMLPINSEHKVLFTRSEGIGNVYTVGFGGHGQVTHFLDNYYVLK